MASFNLGCIRGDKGDAGPKGDKGEKGDRGEAGAAGTDGITPVFSIDKVETLESSLDANVEIDSSDPAQPKLSFYIPKGADGKDTPGDMIESVYDTEGKKTDIYKFAQSLFDNALSKNGGKLSGILTAYESQAAQSCVRNISFSSLLPEKAAKGDICFIVDQNMGQAISEHNAGSIMLVNEGTEMAEYIVAAKNFHKEGTVTLVRKYLAENTEYYDYKIRDSYYCSDIDMYLEGIFTRLLSSEMQKKLVAVELADSCRRHCFLLSSSELASMEYFRSAGIKATLEDGTTRNHYMTRELSERQMVLAVNSTGNYLSINQNVKTSFRPAIVVPGDTIVKNTEYNGKAVMRLIEEEQGIYLYDDGQWKELKI